MPLAGLIDDEFFIDLRNSGFHIDFGNNEIRCIERKRHRRQELAVIAIESPDAAALTDNPLALSGF